MPQPVQNQQIRPHRHPRSTSAQQITLERHRRKCAVCHHPDRQAIEEEFLHWHNPVNIVHEFELGDRRILYRHAHATGLYDQRRRNYLFTIENVLECGDDIDFTAAAYIKAVRAYACLCDTVRWTEPVTRVQHDYHVHTDASSQPTELTLGAVEGPMPQATFDQPAHSAVSSSRATSHEPRATAHEPRPAQARNQQAGASRSAGSVSSADNGEKFLAAAIPLLGASPKAAAQLKKAGLLHLSELAARHVSPFSNRHNLELESPVTPRKQTPEAISNRHKITK